jgi:acetyl-CoA synthetase
MTGFSGPPPHFNMAAYVIGQAARATPDKTALVVVDRIDADAPAETWTYGELEAAVLRIAAGLLARDLRRGDRLLIRLENTSAYALLFFGAIAAGLVPIPTSSQLTQSEAVFVAKNSGARGMAVADRTDVVPGLEVIDADEVVAMLKTPGRPTLDYAATAADDPAYMIYTSGTTSQPKGVLHAQRAAWGRRPMVEGWLGLTGTSNNCRPVAIPLVGAPQIRFKDATGSDGRA